MLDVKIQATGTVETPEQAEERRFQERVASENASALASRERREAAIDAIHPLMKEFRYDGLAIENMKDVGHHYRVLAEIMARTLPHGADRDACLRSLMASLDAAVSAMKAEP
jgi:hypothetical protein